MTSPLTRPETMAELDELALSRTAATGRRCAVVSFAGSDRAQMIDLDETGAVVAAYSVPILHPTEVDE